MSSTLQFAFIYIHGYICLDCEVMIATSQRRCKNHMATILMPNIVRFSGTLECNKLESAVFIDNFKASVTAFFPSITEFYTPSDIFYVCTIFVALTSRPLVLDVSMHQSCVAHILRLPFLAFPNVSSKFKC
jgi:hypothetical protein